MTFTIPSFPWAGTSPGSAGPYSNTQFAAFQQGLFNRQGDPGDSGPAIYSGIPASVPANLRLGFGFDAMQHGAGNMSVDVYPGTAVVQGVWAQLTAIQNMTIGANASGNDRIDTVILHADFTAQTVTLQVKQGTPAATPAPPALTQSAGSIWEIPLADVYVINGAVSIQQAGITPRQVWAGASDGVYLPVFNNSGQTLTPGQVVVWDTSAAQAVKLTTTGGDATVAGVVVGRIPSSGIGIILVRGIGWVYLAGGATNGQQVITSTVSGNGNPQAVGTTPYAFAYALQTTGGNGLCLCYVDASRINQANTGYLFSRPNQEVKRNNGANYTTSSTSFVDMDTTNLAITIIPQGTKVLMTAQVQVETNGGTVGVALDITIDGTRYGGNNGLAQLTTGSGAAVMFGTLTIAVIATGLAANTSHTFKLQWKATNSGGPVTALSNGDFVCFAIAELSG